MSIVLYDKFQNPLKIGDPVYFPFLVEESNPVIRKGEITDINTGTYRDTPISTVFLTSEETLRSKLHYQSNNLMKIEKNVNYEGDFKVGNHVIFCIIKRVQDDYRFPVLGVGTIDKTLKTISGRREYIMASYNFFGVNPHFVNNKIVYYARGSICNIPEEQYTLYKLNQSFEHV